MPTFDERFHKDLTAEDELGAVIRAHIHIESSIIDFVRARVHYPDDLPRLQYEARLRLATSLGLKQEYFEGLKLIGDIRNSFSHKLDATLTDAKINELFSKLCDEGRELTLTAYQMTNRHLEMTDTLPFDKLPARDRFTLIAVTLKAYVAAAAHEAVSRKCAN